MVINYLFTTFSIILESYIRMRLTGSSAHLTYSWVVSRVACAKWSRAFVVSITGTGGWAFAIVAFCICRGSTLLPRSARHSFTRIRHV